MSVNRILSLSCVPMLLSVLLVASAHTAPRQTYVLDSFGAESLVPVIRPMLAEGGSVSSYQGRLVVHTTPNNYAEITRLLKQVDVAPTQLKLSLRVKEDGSYSNRGVNVGDVVITRDRGGKWGAGAEVGIDYSTGSRQRHSTYTVSALSGYRANIDSGTLVSLSKTYVSRYGIANSTLLIPVTQGMTVLPRHLPDGRIQLDVAQQYDRVRLLATSGHHEPQINTQNSQTQLVVQPNQWTSVGSIVQQQDVSRTLGKSSRYINIPIEIKVEPMLNR